MSGLGITIFDPAEALTDSERMAAYVDVVAEEAGDDAGEILGALGIAVRASGSATAVAMRAGLTLEELETALAKGAHPSFEAVLKIARGLGMHIRFAAKNDVRTGKGCG